MTDFYEDDEPIEKIRAAFERGTKGVTQPPEWIRSDWVLASVLIEDCCWGRTVC